MQFDYCVVHMLAYFSTVVVQHNIASSYDLSHVMCRPMRLHQ